VPKSSTQDWYDKEKLYNLLEQEGGISEFLIPLLYTGFISDIIWIRPQWSSDVMVADGGYSFHVGDASKDVQCGVTLRSNYYIDDGVYCDQSQIASKTFKSCNITVFTANSLNEQSTNLPTNPSSWILDICLDYFTVSNPFLVKIRDAISKDCSEIPACHQTIDEIVQILVRSYSQLSYRNHISDDLSSDSIMEERSQVLQILCDFLQDKAEHTPDQVTKLITTCFPTSLDLGKDFVSTINQLSHNTRLLLQDCGCMLLLPHHIASKEEIDANIASFIRIVKAISNIPPSAITIATSADDEYTPMTDVNYVRSMVLKAINEDLLQHWDRDSSTTLTVEVHDLSLVENPTSAAYSIFLNRKCQQYIRVDPSL
jgi:hypothetical protein